MSADTSLLRGIGRLYATLWREAKGDRLRVVAALALLTGAVLVNLLGPWYTAQAVNALQIGSAGAVAEAGWYLLATLGVSAVGWALHGPGRVLERFAAVALRGRFADALYHRLLTLPIAWHARHHSGEIIQRMGRSVGALHSFGQSQFIYIQNAVNLIGPLVALLVICWPVGVTGMLGYVVLATILVRLDRVMVRLLKEEAEADGRFGATIIDGLGNIGTVRALRIEEPLRDLAARRMEDAARPHRRSVVMNEAKWATIDLLSSALRVALVGLYGWIAWREGGTVMVGTAVLVHQYAHQAGGVVNAMAAHWGNLVRWQAELGLADPIRDATETVPPAAPVHADWRELSVHGLSFRHRNGEEEGRSAGVEAVDLTLRRGERVALIGESGSGKSTLLRLLAGLYAPDAARVSVDGVPRLDMLHLGGAGTLIPQETDMFEASLRHNLTFGLPYREEEVAAALDAAGLTGLVAALPQGLDTRIEERGANLSGGQRQRVALARGLLAARGKGLLLLDEPTASLDPATEALVYDTLFDRHPDACVVSTLHRLHLLDRFDRVVVMAAGRVVDQGRPEEVLARRPDLAGAAAGGVSVAA